MNRPKLLGLIMYMFFLFLYFSCSNAHSASVACSTLCVGKKSLKVGISATGSKAGGELLNDDREGGNLSAY